MGAHAPSRALSGALAGQNTPVKMNSPFGERLRRCGFRGGRRKQHPRAHAVPLSFCIVTNTYNGQKGLFGRDLGTIFTGKSPLWRGTISGRAELARRPRCNGGNAAATWVLNSPAIFKSGRNYRLNSGLSTPPRTSCSPEVSVPATPCVSCSIFRRSMALVGS